MGDFESPHAAFEIKATPSHTNAHPIDSADILGGYSTSAADSNPGFSVGDGFSDQYLEIPASDQFFWRRNRLPNLFSSQSGRGAWDLHRQVHLYHRVANGRLRRK